MSSGDRSRAVHAFPHREANGWPASGDERDHGRMRLLVTGHRGNVGGPVAGHLERLGHEVAGFDLADGDDLLDLAEVRRAAVGCAGAKTS